MALALTLNLNKNATQFFCSVLKALENEKYNKPFTGEGDQGVSKPPSSRTYLVFPAPTPFHDSSLKPSFNRKILSIVLAHPISPASHKFRTSTFHPFLWSPASLLPLDSPKLPAPCLPLLTTVYENLIHVRGYLIAGVCLKVMSI